MSVLNISKRYAKSLIDISKDNNILDAVIDDVKGFLEITKDREFMLFLRSPIIRADRKLSVFEELFSSKVHDELMAFFRLVIRKGRENILPEILNVVMEKYNEMKGVTTVVITSAKELSDKEVEKIERKLKNTALAGDKVEFIRHVDPSLIGGFVIEIDDMRYDTSIAGKMKKMRTQLIAK